MSGPGTRYSPSQRLDWSRKLRAIWTSSPTTTIEVASRAAGGAPKQVAMDVRRRLRAEGVLPQVVSRDCLPEGLP